MHVHTFSQSCVTPPFPLVLVASIVVSAFMILVTMHVCDADKNELAKYGLLDAVEMDPVVIDHQKLFGKLLKVLLERRIAEPVFSRVSARW